MKHKLLKISPYLNSIAKRIIDICLSVFILLLTSLVFIVITFLVILTSGLPLFFLQKRTGKNGKPFWIIKFRTMIIGAEKMQKKYIHNNESDGPVFKIHNDPRFTKFGRMLSNTGLDELPQFINVLRGEMSIVGPRPLPVNESRRLLKKYKVREFATPGITSSWVVAGSHKLSFRKWMQLDNEYVYKANLNMDIKIIYQTFGLMIGFIYINLRNH